VETEKERARERTAADRKAAAELQQERAAIVSQMPHHGATIRAGTQGAQGIALAEVVEGRCNVCQMALRLQYFQDLKKDVEILSCESCQRLLYYNPPVAVEDLTGEPAPAVQDR